MRPSVSRVVHYVARGSADGVFPPVCRAAVITQAGAWVDVQVSGPIEQNGTQYRQVDQKWDSNAVHLHVMNPTGVFTDGPMVFDDGDGGADSNMCDGNRHKPGSWHWPAKV